MILRRLYSTHPANFKLPPTIRQLLNNNQESTTTSVSGWIKSIRKQKNLTFAVISDGTTPEGLQAVLLKQQGISPEALSRLVNGTAVRLTGQLIRSPGRGQEWELVIQEGNKDSIEVLGDCDIDTYPIQKKTLSTEYLRDNAYLRARTGQIAAMLRLRNELSQNMSRTFDSQGFTYTHTPIITGNDAEGAGETFHLAPISSSSSSSPSSSSATTTTSTATDSQDPTDLEFFSRPAHLTVSHQLHLEAFNSALSRVYTLSPCFRAERSQTGRHLAEFWMLEAEWNLSNLQKSSSGGGGIEELCSFVESLLRNIINPDSPEIFHLWKSKSTGTGTGIDSEEYQIFRKAFDSSESWPRITYTEAITILETEYKNQIQQAQGTKFEHEPIWGDSLSSEHERFLAESHFKGPLFVTDYPQILKPFYMRLNSISNENENPSKNTVACFDLLVPKAGELVGGSVREERMEILIQRMKDAGLIPPCLPSSSSTSTTDTTESDVGKEKADDSTYEWYLNLRKYGGAPHGGFGLGFERLVAWVGGIDNVRECIGMPRWTGRMIM